MNDVPTSSTYLHLTLKDFSTLLQVIVYILIDHACKRYNAATINLTASDIAWRFIYGYIYVLVQIFRIHAYANVCDNATLVERA